jgi:hypothetical protein
VAIFREVRILHSTLLHQNILVNLKRNKLSYMKELGVALKVNLGKQREDLALIV